MDAFDVHYGMDAVNLESLEFAGACDTDSVKAVLGALGHDWSQNQFTTAPVGAVLRIAEGIDAVNNLAHSGMNISQSQRASAIICGVAQLGGLLFSAAAAVFALLFCICSPIGSACALLLYRRCRRVAQVRRSRDRKIDDMLQAYQRSKSSSENLSFEQTSVHEAEKQPFLMTY